MNRTAHASLPALIGVLLAMCLATLSAMAEDIVKLKNGEEHRGTIVREVEGMIWIEVTYGTITRIEAVAQDEIASVVRDAVSNPAERDLSEPWTPADRETAPASRPGVPRAAVVSLEGMVGMQFAVKPLADMIETLEEMEVDILVLRINSGGGYTFEMARLAEFLHYELKPRFRTVAWIRSAISAAAMTAHNLEEIYFYPEGNYGSATEYSGALNATKGEALLENREDMEVLSSRGGHDPAIMWSMSWDTGLSANIDPRTGEVSFYEGDEGEHIICPVGQVLSFTSVGAEKWGVSRGTAKNLDELAAAMNLSEVEWLGEYRPGFPYPVSEAEEIMLTHRERVTRDEASFNRYRAIYELAVGQANGNPDDQVRAAYIGRAREELRKLYSMGLAHPNFILLYYNMNEDDFRWWFRDQNDMLDEIAAG